MNVLTDGAVVWLDDTDIDADDLAINIQHFVIHSLHTFTDFAACSSFIRYCTDQTRLLLVVVRDHYLDRLSRVALVLVPSQTTVFIYVLGNKCLFRWKTDTRIRDCFHLSEEQRIVNKLKDDLQTHFTQRWSSGFCVFSQDAPQIALSELNNENAKFMWFQLLVKVLLRMPPTTKSKDDLLQQSFLAYSTDEKTHKTLHEFNRTYQAKDAIDWYTKDAFLFRLFNQACRTDDIDLLFKFRFFINDLHQQLTALYHEQQANRDLKQTLIVYRGTVISQDELDILLVPSDQKKLIWLHNFVSTSLKRDAAETFVMEQQTTGLVGVLEEIHIDVKMDMSTAPFAYIHASAVEGGEHEILMAIGTVFELESITKNADGIWEMKLYMTDYDDRIRSELRVCLEEDIEQETSLVALSNFLFCRGDFEKSEKYNKILLDELPLTDPDLPKIYNNLGHTYQKLGKFTDALNCLDTAVQLYLRPNARDKTINFDRKLACAYNNKGLIHRHRGEFDAALEYMNKSLDLRCDNATLPEKERNRLAVERSYSHENLSLLYQDMSNYERALFHLQAALDIRNEKLPPNHHMIAQAYNNLGKLYTLIGNPSKAFECIEQALNRQIQSLPDNHPHRGTMYSNLGEAYYSQGQYPKALSNFEKALNIHQTARTRNPLLEAVALSNMGSVMKAQGNFDGALPTFLHALTIIERQAPHHPDVARCLNNIGFAYSGKGESTMAIDYFNRALDFCRAYLPPNNELTAISYLSLAGQLPGDQYSLATDYFQQVLSIYNHIGLPHHKNVISCHRQWGLLHQRRHEHASALARYERALYHCREAPLPEQHPLWVVIYTSFAHQHYLMGEYQQALKTYEQALRHNTAESLELPRIHAAMDLCAKKIIEADVRQAMAFILDKVVCLVDETLVIHVLL